MTGRKWNTELLLGLTFKYFRSIIQIRGEERYLDVYHTIQMGWMKWLNDWGGICDRRKIPHKVKGQFYHMHIRPTMLY